MSTTVLEEHWGLHGGSEPDKCHGDFANKCEGNNIMSERNYPCDNIIQVYFGRSGTLMDLNEVGDFAFKKQLYMCMIGHALAIKSNIETRRAKNQLGCLVWQYNEIWPTGGWGSIEYGPARYPGQVIGGRWKPLQYWYMNSIFTDVTCACGLDGICYVKNDSPFPFSGSLLIEVESFKDSKSVAIYSEKKLRMREGPATILALTLEALKEVDGKQSIVHAVIVDANKKIVSDNWIPYATPGEMALPNASLSFTIQRCELHDDVVEISNDKYSSCYPVKIVVKTDHIAMYVTLTTLAQGRFSDNAFVLKGNSTKIVEFIPFVTGSFDHKEELELLKKTLRVEHVRSYI
mmetsp:Transcript_20858/g.26593  ORF Transcript_20858/g.26593 Transcript_20858/m.26593 type:complete len:347 (+) Transcript_20858:369-1409(+)|eukprot:CAMPEP_0204864544 /NCGR_PEP_ID=MMETSP1348-20121228/4122_1 /ASSEMBLY_ACC=CAM_ASM_000700 /TAXON_ID=215587 /ORGANISM="Aplanochytrium stocchinoi, Strain GSBS06" /LENGTH=346 /DNA_ID=CAMNT_0052015195 /DNA_START=335 /DNA_END=1375 /DNA_ORIENTATION=+